MKRKCLAIGIILLFVGTCITPTIAQDTEKPLPTSRGNWLYVGGSGPGNYTTIQDAINDSSDGDTVYVYDDSSPYYEHVIIKQGINLIGESTSTTILNGSGTGTIILLNASNVTITNFTLRDAQYCISNPWPTLGGKNNIFMRLKIENLNWAFGIFLHSIVIDNEIAYCTVSNCSTGIHLGAADDLIKEGNKIHHNTIFNNYDGICLTGSGSTCLIYNNTIQNNTHGVWILSPFHIFSNNTITKNQNGVILAVGAEPGGVYTIIEDNIFKENYEGLRVISDANVVTRNLFEGNDRGIMLSVSEYETYCSVENNQIQRNIFLENKIGLILGPPKNEFGLEFLRVADNNITSNNFIDNRIQALCCDRNYWDNNYWDDWIGLHVDACSVIPKFILGATPLFIKLFLRYGLPFPNIFYFPRISCDWHPAQESYDISGMK